MLTRPVIRPQAVRRIRNGLDMTQEALGRLLGVSRSTVAAWETGRRGVCPEAYAKLRDIAGPGESARTMDLDALRDPKKPVPVDLRPLRAALEAIDLNDPRVPIGALGVMLAAAQRALIRYPSDWVRVHDRAACPRVVAGLACARSTAPACVCRAWPLMDHLKLWLTPAGTFALTSEPYGLGTDDVARLLSICEELNLEFTVEAESPHYPTYALLVTITGKEVDDVGADL